jgi:SAM-dependent methyltransferase
MASTDAVTVHPSNRVQLSAWDGDEGAYWAAHADQFERALTAYHDRFFTAAAIEDDHRVLDVGCGTGRTTRDAARRASHGSVVGVDLSAAMLEVARRRADTEGLHNVTFEQADAQIHPFGAEWFDVAIACTSAMFFGDRVAALANIGRALRPRGRLVQLTWQAPTGNEWFREFTTVLGGGRGLAAPRPEAPGPFTLADPDVIRSVLTAAGYADISVEAMTAPMWFGRDTDGAHGLVVGLLGWMLEGLDEASRAQALDDLRTTIADHETSDGVVYESAAWLTTAVRT